MASGPSFSPIHRNSLGYVIGGKSHQAMIVWGKDQSGTRIHIADATSGASDNLRCECGSPLVAKKGDEVSHHFAHAHGFGSVCEQATRSALANFIADTLLDAGRILLPISEGRHGYATVIATSDYRLGDHHAHLIDAQRGRKLIICSIIKRTSISALRQQARKTGLSAMMIDLCSHRNGDDTAIRAALVALASRDWLHRDERHMNCRELRMKYLGRY